MVAEVMGGDENLLSPFNRMNPGSFGYVADRKNSQKTEKTTPIFLLFVKVRGRQPEMHRLPNLLSQNQFRLKQIGLELSGRKIVGSR